MVMKFERRMNNDNKVVYYKFDYFIHFDKKNNRKDSTEKFWCGFCVSFSLLSVSALFNSVTSPFFRFWHQRKRRKKFYGHTSVILRTFFHIRYVCVPVVWWGLLAIAFDRFLFYSLCSFSIIDFDRIFVSSFFFFSFLCHCTLFPFSYIRLLLAVYIFFSILFILL